MYLTIDIGNSRTKSAIFSDDGQLVHAEILTGAEFTHLQSLIASHNVQHIISSVTGKRDWDPMHLKVDGKNILLAHDTPLPIKLIYSTPETLGRDRIAAACGAHMIYPEKACLVIDAGTCITMDVILGSGYYIGGNIAPGLSMRLQAMHDYTAKLPLVEISWVENPFGDSTVHALQNGACLGALMEIEGILNRVRNAFGEVFVVMTGGDAPFLAEKMKNQIFVEPELVIKGLFKILSFNVQ